MNNEARIGSVQGASPPPLPVKRSWASFLGGNLPKKDDNNVLEVVLEKEFRGSFSVSQTECATILRKLGLDPRPGVQVEGVQIFPQGRGVICITLKKGVEQGQTC